MLAILKAYGIPEEFVTAIRIMYEDITPDGVTETFNILAGVLQGDTIQYSSIPFCHSYRLCYENSFTWKGR